MRDIKRQDILTRDAIAGAQEHARACYPEESVGVIHKGQYIEIKNVDPEPILAATPEPEVFRNMLADGKIDCLVHSHVDGSFWPSSNDMAAQIALNIPHGLIACPTGEGCSPLAIWGERLEPAPLHGRAFQHGIHDCYEAIRDWYSVEFKDHSMPPYARDWLWWEKGEDLYFKNIEHAGLMPIDAKKARYGDFVFLKIPTRSKVNGRLCVGETYNHAGIYLENDTIFHHPSTGHAYAPHNKSGLSSLSNRIRGGALFLRMKSRNS